MSPDLILKGSFLRMLPYFTRRKQQSTPNILFSCTLASSAKIQSIHGKTRPRLVLIFIKDYTKRERLYSLKPALPLKIKYPRRRFIFRVFRPLIFRGTRLVSRRVILIDAAKDFEEIQHLQWIESKTQHQSYQPISFCCIESLHWIFGNYSIAFAHENLLE